MADKPDNKRYIINVSLGNDNESRDIFVGCNGDNVIITRGKDVTVPKWVLETLDNAVQGVPETDSNDPSKSMSYDRKRFPYTVIGVV